MLFNAQLENVARIVRSSFYAGLGLQHLVVYTIITILAIMDRLRTIPLKKFKSMNVVIHPFSCPLQKAGCVKHFS